MTMRELARLANVSLSTVSKAFSDAPDISWETKQHIFEIARKTGCYGKFYRGKYSKRVIAIICPEICSDYYNSYIENLKTILEENNCIVLISSFDFNRDKQAEILEYYCSYLQVDGVIVFNLKQPLKKAYDVPMVSLFSSDDPSIEAVIVDTDKPLKEAIELLKKCGHKKIAFLGEKLTTSVAEKFNEIMIEENLEDFHSIKSEFRFEKAGEDGVKQLLSEYPDCTAILCAYDNIAFGAMKQLKRLGFRIPEDISVIGMNNINTSEYTETSLTTIDTNIQKTCSLVWEILVKKLNNKFYHENETQVVQGKLIVRDTVSKIN